MITTIPEALDRLSNAPLPLNYLTPVLYQTMLAKGLIRVYTRRQEAMVRLHYQRPIKAAKVSGMYAVVAMLAGGAKPVTLFRQDSLGATIRRGWVERYYEKEKHMARLTESGQAIAKAIRLAPPR